MILDPKERHIYENETNLRTCLKGRMLTKIIEFSADPIHTADYGVPEMGQRLAVLLAIYR